MLLVLMQKYQLLEGLRNPEKEKHKSNSHQKGDKQLHKTSFIMEKLMPTKDWKKWQTGDRNQSVR